MILLYLIFILSIILMMNYNNASTRETFNYESINNSYNENYKSKLSKLNLITKKIEKLTPKNEISEFFDFKKKKNYNSYKNENILNKKIRDNIRSKVDNIDFLHKPLENDYLTDFKNVEYNENGYV